MPSGKKDAWITFTVCLLLGGSVMGDTLRYPAVQGQGFGQGPGFYPQVLAGALLLLGALSLIQAFRSRDHSGQETTEPRNETKIRHFKVILLLVLCIVLVGVMKYSGFLTAGFLLTFLSVRLIRGAGLRRHILTDLLFSVGILIVVYFVFQIFVGIDLPGSVLMD